MLLVLAHLQPDPHTLGIAVPVELCQKVLALVFFAVHVLPSWAFWHEEDCENDERREHELQPEGQEPGDVAGQVQGTPSRTGCHDGTRKPGFISTHE